MSKIKDKKPCLKTSGRASHNDERQENPSFSFQYLTNDKKYNFEKLDMRSQFEWKSSLFERMKEISLKSWVDWSNIGKIHGYEKLPAKQISFKPNGYVFSEDEKVIVFRFNEQNGRILGIKKSNSSVYYVIGFDTDFSAYKH